MDVAGGIRIEEGFIFADLAHLAPPGIGYHPADGQGIELGPAVAVGFILLLFGKGHFALAGLDLRAVPQGHDGELFQSQHRGFGAAGRPWRQQEDQAQTLLPLSGPSEPYPPLLHVRVILSAFLAMAMPSRENNGAIAGLWIMPAVRDGK